MAVRKNQNTLSGEEKRAFVSALLEMKRRGVYDDFVRAHWNIMTRGERDTMARTAHRSPSFLPWHRKYLLDFERALQAINPQVSLPYWDWTVDREPTASLWADDFFGGTGDRREGYMVKTGPFAHSTGNWTINVSMEGRPFLRRDLGNPDTNGQLKVVLPTAADVQEALAASVYDVAPWNSGSATGFRSILEGFASKSGLHNVVHEWVGGSMLPMTSPNEPAFFLHHCFIDKLWADWQRAHPDQSYLPAEPTPLVRSIDDVMQPWNDVTPRQMLDHTQFYTYE
jgi:tyrosinase